MIPELAGKLDGIALRVPVPTGSIIDLVCTVGTSLCDDPTDKSQRLAAVERVNQVIKQRADGRYLTWTEEPLVSSDLIGHPASSIVDLLSTNVIGSHQVKVLSWYDNEWGYSCRLAELAHYLARRI